MKNLIAFEKIISISSYIISYVLLQNTYKILFFSKICERNKNIQNMSPSV